MQAVSSEDKDIQQFAQETASKIDAMFGAYVLNEDQREDHDRWDGYGGNEEEEGRPEAFPLFELPPLTRTTKKQQKEEGEAPAPLELWKILLAVLVCLLFAMGSYLVGRVYGATLIPDEPVYAASEPEDEDEPTSEIQQTANKEPQILTALLMGTDQRFKNEMARADTIILVMLNLDTLQINMISIPRDTRCIIAESDSLTKINAAHAIGGPELMRKTVEKLLGLTIHYYAETNFQGFAKCIDIILPQGLDYQVERRMYFPEEGIDLMAGQQKLNGDKALQYARWRGDPTADIGRIARQQKLIKAVLEQSMRLATVTKLPELTTAIRDNLLTDMSLAQMLNLVSRLLDVQSLSFESVTLPGEAKTIGGGAYWIMDEEETDKLLMGIVHPEELEEEPEVAEVTTTTNASETMGNDEATDNDVDSDMDVNATADASGATDSTLT